MSVRRLRSRPARFVASDSKTTKRPSRLTSETCGRAPPKLPFCADRPPRATLTSCVRPVARSRTKTSSRPLSSARLDEVRRVGREAHVATVGADRRRAATGPRPRAPRRVGADERDRAGHQCRARTRRRCSLASSGDEVVGAGGEDEQAPVGGQVGLARRAVGLLAVGRDAGADEACRRAGSTNTSGSALASPGTRFVAREVNARWLPSASSTGSPDDPSAGAPPRPARRELDRAAALVVDEHVAHRAVAVLRAVRFVAAEVNAIRRASPDSAGCVLGPLGSPAAARRTRTVRCGEGPASATVAGPSSPSARPAPTAIPRIAPARGRRLGTRQLYRSRAGAVPACRLAPAPRDTTRTAPTPPGGGSEACSEFW